MKQRFRIESVGKETLPSCVWDRDWCVEVGVSWDLNGEIVMNRLYKITDQVYTEGVTDTRGLSLTKQVLWWSSQIMTWTQV